MLLPIADFSYPLSVELLDFKPFRQLTRLRDSMVDENAVKLSDFGVLLVLHIELFYGLSGLPVRLSSLGYRHHGRLPEYRC